jgi:DNA-binding CsgD family transcriptional regulator
MDARSPQLRPRERRVLSLSEAGVDDTEIARRFQRSPEWVAKVRSLATLRDPHGTSVRGDVLRPLERRVLRWRGEGVSHEAMAPRFRRSPAFLARVEHLALYKLHSD